MLPLLLIKKIKALQRNSIKKCMKNNDILTKKINPKSRKLGIFSVVAVPQKYPTKQSSAVARFKYCNLTN